ncbi:unnamed protein product [Durusdinium trenchii]|uniref:Uncharacterized protein n=1 Tax=Durusdinium trenchii TaxID=1381693 RepID=A0ABP0Q004_9DINO
MKNRADPESVFLNDGFSFRHVLYMQDCPNMSQLCLFMFAFCLPVCRIDPNCPSGRAQQKVSAWRACTASACVSMHVVSPWRPFGPCCESHRRNKSCGLREIDWKNSKGSRSCHLAY